MHETGANLIERVFDTGRRRADRNRRSIVQTSTLRLASTLLANAPAAFTRRGLQFVWSRMLQRTQRMHGRSGSTALW
jgi:hypothetical protein